MKRNKALASTAEFKRLRRDRTGRGRWKKWGPYLSERAWGTVREDYSPDGSVWDAFPHDAARSRVYRWNEDGLCGFSDRDQFLCFALGLWNHADPILKERLFGLTGPEGNHGEDVKECYFYRAGTPTHSYMEMAYKYPQRAFPYAELVAEGARRTFYDAEYELLDTGIFADKRYFDVTAVYFKIGEDDWCGQIDVTNRGPATAPCTVLAQLWFRNTWSWGYARGPLGDTGAKPCLRRSRTAPQGVLGIDVFHEVLGAYHFYARQADELLFTENETNAQRLFGQPNAASWVKDAFHAYVVEGDATAVNRAGEGTKAAALFALQVEPGQTRTVQLRLSDQPKIRPFHNVARARRARQNEMRQYYDALLPADLDAEAQRVQRQAYADLLWSKQLYYLDVAQWLQGDPAGPAAPVARQSGRNRDWRHLRSCDILSMPDKWEYPWYATWELAFQCLSLARIDPDCAKRQLALVTREWHLHPNGQLPAHEWRFADAGPPVQAWAARRVFDLDAQLRGAADVPFLQRVFHKLLLNFAWWTKRTDRDGRNVFQGGFLGLDRMPLLDRNAPLARGGLLEQADGTAWMAFYALEMMLIALRLAEAERAYADAAVQFYERFLRLATVLHGCNETGLTLWDEDDGFYYDALRLPDGSVQQLKVRSCAGWAPLLAVAAVDRACWARFPECKRRIDEFAASLPGAAALGVNREETGANDLFAAVSPARLRRMLGYLLDENEFLSPYGLRSLSRHHAAQPLTLVWEGRVLGLGYEPGDARTNADGGNANWRGPIWLPLNFLLLEALDRYYDGLGPDFRVECPAGSGQMRDLRAVNRVLAQRLGRLFLPDAEGRRPWHGADAIWRQDPAWRDLVLFHEYFHGDTGQGLGASHHAGTGLVAEIMARYGAAVPRRHAKKDFLSAEGL